MSQPFGFCDLCITIPGINKTQLRKTLEKSYKMGYSTVAINQTVKEPLESVKKDKKKTAGNDASSFSVPSPEYVKDLASEFAGKLRILSRITFIFSEPIKTHNLNQSLNLRKYDLYAVAPKTQEALQFACCQLNVDIICLNTSSMELKLSKKLYGQAAERGIHFEIRYSSVLNEASRKTGISSSHLYHMYGKSKNVIVTSGAMMASQIRSPYDIVNLASILGLSETKAKASILTQSRYLILRAEGRRFGKAVFGIQPLVSEEQKVEMETEESEDSDDCTNSKRIKLI